MDQPEQAIRNELKVLLMYHYGFDSDIADDAIQEVCENLIEQGGDYRKDLFRLAYWKALDLKRRQEARRESPLYEEGASCPACHDTRDEAQRARYRERHRQEQLAAQRGTAHIGAPLKEI